MKKPIYSILLTIVMGSCVLFSSCDSQVYEPTVSRYAYTDGIHDFTAPETENYLVKNGSTSYKLLVPEKADRFMVVAQNEFIDLFRQATGITIQSVVDSGELQHSETAQYISLGDTNMSETAELNVDYDVLGTQGVRIITKDESVYLLGGSTQGVLYAVYDFMQLVFDYEVYYTDCWKIEKNVTDKKLPAFDVTDVPDIEMRCPGWGPVMDNVANIGYRFRTPLEYTSYIMPLGDPDFPGAGKASVHNSNEVIPYARWANVHPRWFTDKGPNKFGAQLCYTARGDKEEYQELIDQIAYVITENMKLYPTEEFPNYNLVGLMIEDDSLTCGCDACINAKNMYGSDSGAAIVLCNNVMAKVEEITSSWEQDVRDTYYRKNLKLIFFAYNGFIEAPTNFDQKSGQYVTNHPDLEMRDDVGVFMALNSGLNYLIGVYDDANTRPRENCLSWMDITDNVYVWTYAANYASYMTLYNSFNFFTHESYQFFIEGGVKLMYNQGARQNKDTNNFNGLKAFLDYKLQWDSTLDEKALTDEWFNAMYGVAAPIMKTLFEKERTHSNALYEEMGLLDHYRMTVDIYAAGNFSLNTLREWKNDCEQALTLAKEFYAQYDPQTYEMIKKHIDMEWVSPAYLMLSLYNQSYIPAEEYAQTVAYFKEVVGEVGTMCSRESGGSLLSFLNTLA